MKINEIQSTLDQLRERHPDLDEGLLSTLLSAGGWDENSIRDAKLLFKADNKAKELPHEDNVNLPEPIELLLNEHNEDSSAQEGVAPVIETKLAEVVEQVPEIKVEEKPIITEKQSLVVSNEESLPVISTNSPIPHNLPLKPFEASPHIWPFSKYKEVFYGNAEDEVVSQKVEPKKEVIKEIVKEIPKAEEVIPVTEKVEAPVVTSHEEPASAPAPVNIPEIKLTKVPLTKPDEGIIVTMAMLALVLIILAFYMIINGRL